MNVAPVLVITLRANDKIDPFGYIGTCLYDNGYPMWSSYHDALHPAEKWRWKCISGKCYKGRTEFGDGFAAYGSLLLDDKADGIDDRVSWRSAHGPLDPS